MPCVHNLSCGKRSFANNQTWECISCSFGKGGEINESVSCRREIMAIDHDDCLKAWPFGNYESMANGA